MGILVVRGFLAMYWVARCFCCQGKVFLVVLFRVKYGWPKLSYDF